MNRLQLTTPTLLAALISILALAPETLAAQPATANLNPPPPPFLTCKAVGGGTNCSGTRQVVEDPVATGIVCGSGTDAFEIYDQGVENQRLTISYDAGGNIERVTNHERWAPAWWSNPLTNATVPYTQSNMITTVFAVPGDFGSATETTVGEINFTDPQTGTKVLRSVGHAVISPADGTVLFSSGQQPLLDAFVNGDMSVFDDLCAALA